MGRMKVEGAMVMATPSVLGISGAVWGGIPEREGDYFKVEFKVVA